jgi:predicted metal-dependent phosphoesterase TrpH
LTIANERLIKTEFHLHTAETSPCGKVPARELVRAFAETGYGTMIVTDHYLPGMFESRGTRGLFLKGYRAARAAAESVDFTVLPGLEFRFDGADNDFLIYGMEEADFPKLPDTLCRYSLADFHAYCRDRGFLVFQAHPFRPWCKVRDPAHLDGVEVYNGNVRQENHNGLALAFARKHRLLEVAGGDVHQLSDVREAALLVPETLLTPKGIVEYLRTHPKVGAEFEEPLQK